MWYDRCGYVGDFYENVYLDSTCTGLQSNVEAVAGPAVAVVAIMFISFCIQVRSRLVLIVYLRGRRGLLFYCNQVISQRRRSSSSECTPLGHNRRVTCTRGRPDEYASLM